MCIASVCRAGSGIRHPANHTTGSLGDASAQGDQPPLMVSVCPGSGHPGTRHQRTP
jgi:hypothetical protein